MSQQQSASKSRSTSASNLPPLPTSPTPNASHAAPAAAPSTRTPPQRRTAATPAAGSSRYPNAAPLRYGSASGSDADDAQDESGEYKPPNATTAAGPARLNTHPQYANAYSPSQASTSRKRGRSAGGTEDDENVSGGSAGTEGLVLVPAAGTHSAPSVAGRRGPAAKDEKNPEDWTRTRKDNHKEVERRRRETINDGINDLKEIVPGCEKNKGSILQRAVQYIQQLKDAEGSNIEKWTLEKLLSDQAMAEAQSRADAALVELETWKAHASSLEAENDTLREENERLRELVKDAGGIIAEDGDEGGGKRRKVD